MFKYAVTTILVLITIIVLSEYLILYQSSTLGGFGFVEESHKSYDVRDILQLLINIDSGVLISFIKSILLTLTPLVATIFTFERRIRKLDFIAFIPPFIIAYILSLVLINFYGLNVMNGYIACLIINYLYSLHRLGLIFERIIKENRIVHRNTILFFKAVGFSDVELKSILLKISMSEILSSLLIRVPQLFYFQMLEEALLRVDGIGLLFVTALQNGDVATLTQSLFLISLFSLISIIAADMVKR